MAWRVRADPLRFEEAEQFLRDKVPMSRAEYRRLTLQAAQRAFTIAGVAQLDLISEALRSLQQAVEKGTPYEEWARTIGPRLESAWGGARPWRLELIFRQNVLSAYAAGRYEQQTDPEVLRARPFWMYDAVLDSGTTPICRGLNGLIRRHDDPIWQRIYPPNHFGCRAGVRSLTAAEAEARGGPTREIQPVEVPPGFALPPTTNWQPDPSKYDPELWAVLQGKLAERIQIGREILEVRGELSAKELGALRRGIEGLNINRWIRQNPIQRLEVAPRFDDLQPGTLGEYDPTTETLRVVYPRPANTWGQPPRLGALGALSTIGRTALEAASITVVHEFAHHLYLELREEYENRLFARYIKVKKERKFISSRSSINVLEWFSEMVAAYRFARTELRRFDPVSFAIIEGLLDDLR